MLFKPSILRSISALQQSYVLVVQKCHLNRFAISTLVQNQNPQYETIYNLLFSLLTSPPNLSETKKLHALLIHHGYFHPTCQNGVLGSQLVYVYVKFNSFNEALVTFEKLPNKNNVAWNAMLRGFVDMGQFYEAIEFYHLMLKQGIVPDNYTYPIVLKVCSVLSDYEEGKRVFDLIRFNEIHHYLKPNVFVECAVIDFLAKCGSLEEANEVFDKMRVKDLASWTAIISGTVRSGDWVKALSLFSRMRFKGSKPDSIVMAVIIPACGRMEGRGMGMALHGYALNSGFNNDLYVSNALIDMYCKSVDTHEAYRLFCEMDCKDEVSWTTMISGYSQNGHYIQSLELYHRRTSCNIRTSAVMAASILSSLGKLRLSKQGKEMHNYILKQGSETDIVLGSALIDMYANCGLQREAEHVFEIMFDTDIAIWNSMIVGYALNGDLDSAFGIFQRLWDSNVKLNFITLVIILPLCTRMGNFRQGKEIHGYTIKSCFRSEVTIFNSLIDMYCKCGFIEHGVKVFEQVMEKNIVTYNTIISAHGIHGRGELAFTFFSQMQKARIRPNQVTFLALLSACSHAGLVSRGWFFFNSMINDYGTKPTTEHYSCIVDLLGRAGRLIDACKFIQNMPIEPDINIWGSLLGACRVHNSVELARVLEKEILQNHVTDPGHYVVLSNIFASNKRWRESLQMRTMIKERGLIKSPANSFIQVGLRNHVFHAGGQIHPEFDKIKEVLERLLLEMKGEGYLPDPTFFQSDLLGEGDRRRPCGFTV